MNAAIDFGNTQMKIGLFSGSELAQHLVFQNPQEAIAALKKAKINRVIVSNVGKAQDAFLQTLEQSFQVEIFTHQTSIPIRNKYKTPETLGMDRLAGILGAWSIFPNQASLVIDMGTCITYDFVTQSGEYIGGSIAPGLQMRAKAMHQFTANLPLVELNGETDLVGKNTQECLRSGALNGVRYETDGIIHAYQERFGLFNTVLCGGDAIFFETQLKASIFVRQEIVLVGLNTVLNYNSRKVSA